jgi:hypothetical protein
MKARTSAVQSGGVMSDPHMRELLRRRFDIVAHLSQATSQLQKCRQVLMAADMDLLRYEASARAEEAESGLARCRALIAEMEESLAETDREIEMLAAR